MKQILFAVAVLTMGLTISQSYHLQLLTFIGIHTILALGLNMLMGYAGQISLGHAAFYGLGAYATGILTAHWGWSPWAALPVALAGTFVVAFLVALPMLKLSGYYLGMGTLGFGMIAFIVFREWSSLTGGDSGLVGIPSLTVGTFSVSSGKPYFFLVWGCVLLAFIACERLVDSRVGRALRAIHDSEKAAAAMGIDTSRLKIWVFVFTAVLAGLAGFLYAHLVTFISPNSFGFLVSIRIVTMVVIGGMASIWGSLLGAAVLTILPDWLHVFTDYEMVVYGLILMAIMIFVPQGLTRGILDTYERSRRKAFTTPDPSQS